MVLFRCKMILCIPVSFTMEDLRYQWKGGDDNGVDVSFSVGLPEFMQVKLFEGIVVAIKFSH